MFKSIKITIILYYINSIILLLSIFTLKVNSETKIIAKSGDTLFKISKEYGVTLKELMYKNNFNDATKIIEGEVIIIPHKEIDKYKNNEYVTYKVSKGDTLYKIARDYNVSLNDIISMNNLKNDSYLKLNQIIFLPKGTTYKKVVDRENIKLASKKVFYHQTSNKDDLSTIAYIHKIPIEQVKTLNKLNYPIKIKPNFKLKLRTPKPSKWIKYGSLIINWSDWTYFDGNYIAQSKTKKNKAFYLALNCTKRALNNTLNNSYWTNWYFPETDFEFKLISDFCDQDFKL
ncbi:LysM domain-containing protein [Prochlorococcus sp. MIT 0801]|uniref:LysM peptidoglycan-binding domain-containing protein n=1 Tax=Prochlorococcus sp. MIT 0801 TaxID=1501269 RepID=UPI0004F6BC8D|nr:LysM domain-containing protein [Prochlorococcus sp. MIT 0801]AIQ96531.1 putative LysM domain [Prochlorococcus sp. MIT 0801]